jgi:creatinine amidohydrolase
MAKEQPGAAPTVTTTTRLETEAVWGHYANLRPETLHAIQALAPIAYLPWGALDLHGPHMPMGADGIVAEAVAKMLVQRTGGVLLPATWWPAAPNRPDNDSLPVRTEVVRHLWHDIFEGLATNGWRVAVVITGNYAREHELALIDTAEHMLDSGRLLVLALPPLAIIDESLLDHGAIWETSLLLSLYPELVDLYALGEDKPLPETTVVRGRDPRGTASASLGDTVLHLAVERIAKAVEALVNSGDAAPLHALYAQRRQRYL